MRGIAYRQQGRYEEAVEVWKKCLPRWCDDSNFGLGYLGHVYAVSGRRAEALGVLEELKERWEAKGAAPEDAIYGGGIESTIAQVYAGLGEREQALDWLERGVEAGAFMHYLGIEPGLRSLHAEPRFRALLERVGLE